MDIDLIERLMGLVERRHIEELEVRRDGWRVRLSRSDATPRSLAPAVPLDAPVPTGPSAPDASAARRHAVKAPLVGTFFRSPAPGAPPFAQVGDHVAEGQTLGLLEAMKMLNAVEADRAGRILEIPQADATLVQAGTPLFVIEAAAG